MFLYNSRGLHIANFLNQSLYSPTGENIGSYIPQFNIFIDLNGQYLGEIVEEHYLITKINSPFLNINLGIKNSVVSIITLTSPNHQKTLESLGFNKDVVISI